MSDKKPKKPTMPTNIVVKSNNPETDYVIINLPKSKPKKK